ncbi:hypothetical protein D3C84_409550 [compost metagenome]
MHYVTDVALVDAHAESDGGDDASGLPAHEPTLNRLALLMGQTRVVGLGLKPVLAQVLGNLLGGFLQGHIDDARLPDTLAHPLQKTATLVLAAHRFNQQIEVRPVESGGHHIVWCNGELRLHVGDHLGRGGRGQQQGLGDIELALVVRQLQVIGAEVVTPLGNAVRLVHHQQRDRHLLQEVAKALVLQALHGNHQDLQLATARPRHHLVGVVATLGRINTRCRDPVALQERQLVLHQRQQRRDHQCQVRQQQGGQLITQGLARPGRENRRCRTSGQHRTDCRFLARPELWITKDLFEGVVHKRSLR